MGGGGNQAKDEISKVEDEIGKRSVGSHLGRKPERVKSIPNRSFLFSLLKDQQKSSASSTHLLFDVGARRDCWPFMSRSAAKCLSSRRELQ